MQSLSMQHLIEKAEAGDSGAISELIHRYLYGDGVEKDYYKAIEMLLRVPLPDVEDNDETLAGLKVKSFGDVMEGQDAEVAYNLYKIAAEKYDERQGWYKLGIYSLCGIVVEADPATGFSLIKKAAEQEYWPAVNALGACYERGLGVKTDPFKAFRYYMRASFHNDYDACNNMGVCLLNGVGTAVDEVMAVQYFTEAAEHGVALGEYNLGYCYANGIGIEMDRDRASTLFALAKEHGFDGSNQ